MSNLLRTPTRIKCEDEGEWRAMPALLFDENSKQITPERKKERDDELKSYKFDELENINFDEWMDKVFRAQTDENKKNLKNNYMEAITKKVETIANNINLPVPQMSEILERAMKGEGIPEDAQILAEALLITLPTRQSLHEVVQLKIMEHIYKLKLEKTRERLKTLNELHQEETKTIDAIGTNCQGNPVYVQCKFVKMEGGHQDNQIHDLLRFSVSLPNKRTTNYMVMSGKYGIEKILKEMKANKYWHSTDTIILMDKTVKIYEPTCYFTPGVSYEQRCQWIPPLVKNFPDFTLQTDEVIKKKTMIPRKRAPKD